MAFDAHIPQIAGVIQLAVAPVFLLTAIGTVIAALNIRLGRAVDRRRGLEAKLPSLTGPELASAREELAVIAMLVFAMLALIACLLLFLREIFLALSSPRQVPR